MKLKLVLQVLLFSVTQLLSQVPDYEFIIEPTYLMSSYYDYMPGGYNNIPIHIQPDISYPNGHTAGGVYITFHAQEVPGPERFVYYSYIDSFGNVISTDRISTNDARQGFVGIDIDQISANPVCSWHAVDADISIDCLISTDIYNISGSSGNWTQEFVLLDNPEVGLPLTGFIDDEFIWPAVYISNSSPLGEDYRRIFISANNNSFSHGDSYLPCENVLFCYTDFLTSDLNNLSDLDWTYNTIEQMDTWSAENPYRRPIKAYAVQENIVIYAGYLINYEFMPNLFFVLLNENYGEGPFEFYSHVLDNESDALCSKNMNIVFRDNNSKISFVGVRYDGINQHCPRLISFDLNSHEFSFLDLSIASLPFIYYEDIYYHNSFKIVGTDNKLVAVWQDCLKALRASQGLPGYEEWLGVVEIVICISNDSGGTWSDPIFLNAIETEELEGLIPSYVYPGDVIEDLGDDHGKLHLLFYSDNSYGSSIYGYGQDNGGVLMYTAIDIDFGSISSSENIAIPQKSITMQNYPNPFNPTTTISFSILEESNVELSIYNIKGQKIIKLVSDQLSAGQHSAVWNGKDSNNKQVSSGIYFYKLRTGDFTQTKKMMLIK